MNGKFFPCDRATVQRDDLVVTFYRLHEDARDAMCDSPKPEWKAVDEFIVELRSMEPITFSRKPRFAPPNAAPIRITKIVKKDEYRIRTRSRRVANYIWYLTAKAGASFETIKDMDEARQFA